MSFESPFFYLYLMAFTISFPLLRSFEKKIAYYKSYPSLFGAIALSMVVFIPWDAYFTHLGIWGFNPRYLSGIYIANLPLGEWLFFIAVPYSCVFIYRALNYFFPKDMMSQTQAKSITQYFAWLSIGIAVLSWGSWYTVSAFGVLATLCLLHIYVFNVDWLPKFYRAYAVILIPFTIVNGMLTGTGLDEEVVWYNDSHNLGKRILTIPFDDVFYGMALILMVITWYEYFESRKRKNPA